MQVELTAQTAAKKMQLRRLKTTARKILSLLKQDKVELSLRLVDNREMHSLNARYRRKDAPTDVLSFPSGAVLPTGTRLLGDVVISAEQAKLQAKEYGFTLEEELERLLVHGILHLLGYDHERSKAEAKRMRAQERKIYRAL